VRPGLSRPPAWPLRARRPPRQVPTPSWRHPIPLAQRTNASVGRARAIEAWATQITRTLIDCSAMAGTLAQSGSGAAPFTTHEVFNQVPPLEGLDVFASNLPLVEATDREGAGWIKERASQLGRLVGGEPQQEWGRLANENKPIL